MKSAGLAAAARLLLALAALSAAPVGAQSEVDPEAVARFLEEGEARAPIGAVLEAVDIVGNHDTTRDFILARLQLRRGDALDEARVEESRLVLLNSGLFKSVEMSLRRGTRRGRVILVVDVRERNTLLIDELYLGSSSVSPLFGGFGLSESNLFGEGVVLSLAGAAGRDRRSARLEWFVPNLSTTPLQLLGSVNLATGVEPVDEADPTANKLDYTRFGGTFGFGLITGRAQRVSLTYRLEGLSVERLRWVDEEVLQHAPSAYPDESVISTLRASWEHNTQDSSQLPTRGHLARMAVEVGTNIIGSSYEFSKYTLELSQAISLAPRHGLTLDFFGGFIQGQAAFFDQFFPVDYSYFLWGKDALRRSVDLNFSESNNYEDVIISVGATYYYALYQGGGPIPRLVFFTGVDLTGASSLDEMQTDRPGSGPRFPLSFDVGLKLETEIGVLSLSAAYIVNLVW